MRVAEAGARLAVLATGLALGAGTALAADPQQGRLLYETYCGTCHYPKLHERKATKIESFAALKEEVAKWAAQTPRHFTPGEIDDITEYLNQSHYRVAK
jgi:mono/diheme cytochrome c family protein